MVMSRSKGMRQSSLFELLEVSVSMYYTKVQRQMHPATGDKTVRLGRTPSVGAAAGVWNVSTGLSAARAGLQGALLRLCSVQSGAGIRPAAGQSRPGPAHRRRNCGCSAQTAPGGTVHQPGKMHKTFRLSPEGFCVRSGGDKGGLCPPYSCIRSRVYAFALLSAMSRATTTPVTEACISPRVMPAPSPMV